MPALPARRAALCSVAALTLMTSVPAMAQSVALLPVGPDGAREMARQMDEVIGLYLAPKAQKAAYEWKGGPPSVTPNGDHYDIVTNGLSIRWPDGTALDLDGLKLQATPKDDGTVALTGSLPSKATVSERGKVEAELAVGRQSFAGVWAPAYATFVKLDLTYGDGVVTTPKDKGKATFGGFTMSQSMTRERDDLFSGPGAWTAENIAVTDEKGQEVLFVGKLDAAGTATRVDLGRMKRMAAYVAETPENQITPDRMFAEMKGLIAGFDLRGSVAGVRIKDPSDNSSAELGLAAMRMGVENLDQAQGGARFSVEFRDLKSNQFEEFKQAVPTVAEVSLAATRIPTDLFSRLVDPKAPNKPVNEAAVLAALQQAGTEIKLEPTKIEAPLAAGNAEGAVGFVTGAAHGVAGKLAVTLRGLDAVVNELKPKPGKKPNHDTAELLSGLAMLQAMGQMSKDAQGRDLRTFNFELTTAGALMLNGADMSAMLGLGGPDGADVDDEEDEDQPKKATKGKN